jgi:glycosyltransferase involved in cell wall biosynthesis
VRILYLSGWFPYPPDNGARMRSYNLLRQLARWHEITLLSFVREEQVRKSDASLVDSFCRVLRIVPYRKLPPSRPRTLLSLFSTWPRSLPENHNPQMEAQIQAALRQHTFDLIIASEIGPGMCTAPYVLGLDDVPRVVEDLELLMMWDQIHVQHTWMGRARLRVTLWKQQQYAAYLLRQVEGCTVASDQERALVQSIAPDFEPLAVIPNGLDLELYGADWGPSAVDTLIFPGALTFGCNFAAMAFFLRDVFPLIQSQRPGVTLRITGRTDGVPLHRLPLNDGVILTGYLEDVRPAVARSQVCVVPLLTGGGTRLKILEAMALSTPVVSTSKGAEGLEAKPGEDILIADEPGDFADAVLRLLGDPALRAKLAANGRRLVYEKCGWERIAKKLDRLLGRVVEKHGDKGAT